MTFWVLSLSLLFFLLLFLQSEVPPRPSAFLPIGIDYAHLCRPFVSIHYYGCEGFLGVYIYSPTPYTDNEIRSDPMVRGEAINRH